jgi:hypothetical protein
MKNLAFALLASGMLVATGLKAQTVDEIVKKHNEAVGGEKAWKSVSSIIYTGSTKANGMEVGIKKSVLAGKAMRTDIDLMGQKGFSIVTPSKGWTFFPFAGQTKPEEMKAEDLKISQAELQVMDELMSYKDRGGKLELVGKEQIDGKDVYKVKFTDKDGSVTTLYVDPSTFYIVRKVATMMGQEVVSNISDYKKLPEGIVVPMTWKTEQGDLAISKVEVNTIKDDKLFKPEANGG